MTTSVTASMVAPKYDLVCDQGYDLDFVLVYEDSTGTPINLTGYRIKMQIRFGYAEETAALTLDSSAPSASYITTVPSTGKITFHIDSTDTVGLLAPKTYVYDIRFYIPGGAEQRKMYGNFSTRPQVTYA